MTDAKRDNNYVPTLIGVSSADGITPVTAYVDPTTHRVLMQLSSGGSLATLSDVTITGVAQGDILYYNGTKWVNLPASTNGYVLTTQGVGANPAWAAAASAGANTALSNLASVAINTALIPGSAAGSDFGSATKPWKDLYIAGSSGTPGTNNFKITGASTSGLRTITLPDASGTVALTANKLSVFAATSSAELAGVISDETGSGLVVFNNGPTFIAPVLGAAVGTSLTLSAPGTSSTDVPNLSSTNTLTNKRITKRVVTVTQSATPTINTDNTDVAYITGLAQAVTSFTTNLSGTPSNGDTLIIDITDSGTGRALTWGTSFEASTVALPTTTVASTKLTIGFRWNTVTSKWTCVAVA